MSRIDSLNQMASDAQNTTSVERHGVICFVFFVVKGGWVVNVVNQQGNMIGALPINRLRELTNV